MMGGPARWLAGALVGLISSLICGQALAHDFWIEPATFAPQPGQVVPVRLLVGEQFNGEPVARPAPARLNRFILVDAQRQTSSPLPGRTGADPAGLLRLTEPGGYLIGYHGKPNPVELLADKFNAYLLDEGLDAVLAQRAERGQLDQPVREIFSRCAKSLVSVGDVGSTAQPPADRELGFTLELIAQAWPASLSPGQPLPLRLVYEGQPLAGALVVAMPQSEPGRKVSARSDARGRVQLPLAQPGVWLVKAVFMRPAPPGSGADWESLWASLSFALPLPPPPGSAAQ